MEKKLTREEIQRVVIEVIAQEMDIPSEEILPDMALEKDLELTSLDAMNVIMELEKRFEVETKVDAILELTHIDELVAYLDDFLQKE